MRTGVLISPPRQNHILFLEEAMKPKQAKPKQAKQVQDQPLTLMAVQEKLGLFLKQAEKSPEEQEHDYLNKKPLGLI
jgi:hypothetical protein